MRNTGRSKKSWGGLELMEERIPPSSLFGLTDNNFIVGFNSASPQTFRSVAVVTGLQVGEKLVGIDFRPRTGQLFGVGVVAGSTDDTLRVYTINPVTGLATAVTGSAPLTVAHGSAYEIDFNPTADRLRVVNDADANLRINPNSGAATVDVNLTPSVQVRGIAYDRNEDSSVSGGSTTLFGISAANSSLVTIGGLDGSPSADGGVVMNSQSLGVTLAPGSEIGFDIPAAGGTGFATLRSNATGLTGLYAINLNTGVATPTGILGNGLVNFTGLAAVSDNWVAVGSGPGAPGVATVQDGATGTARFAVAPYGAFAGGVRVAIGDVNGDGAPDLVTAPGPGGGPFVRVYSGLNGQPLAGAAGAFPAFDPQFLGGVNVAVGDVNGDGQKDIIVGADAGGVPLVRVFSGADGSMISNFLALPAGFTGGIQVTSADFDRDGNAEIVVAANAGGVPLVRVFDRHGNAFTSAALPNFVNTFYAYDAAFRGGLSVAAGDVNGDGIPDIVTGAGPGGGAHVRIFNGTNGADAGGFFAYESLFTGGVRVAVADVNGDGIYDVETAPGPGRLVEVRAFDAVTRFQLSAFNPFGAFMGGGTVSGTRF